MKPARVLVVGGTSFIGRHAIRQFVASGAEVFATVRDGAGAAGADGVRWLETDLTDDDPCRNWPRECDAVIYLAQSRAWRRFPEGAADVFDVNVRGVAKAAEYARQVNARRFVLMSSGSVYGASSTGEDQPFAIAEPRHFYVATKLSAELLLASYAPYMNVVVLRLFVPYGPDQSAEMLIPQLVEKVRTGAPILLDGDEGLRANPVFVGDVVRGVERCLQIDRTVTLNVAGPETLSLREIGQAIGRVIGREPQFEKREGTPRNVAGDTHALRAILDWAPDTTFETGLRTWLTKS